MVSDQLEMCPETLVFMLRDCIKTFLIAALFAFLCESGVLAQQYISRGGSDVPQRGVYEVALESSRTPAEPYLGVQFDVTFTTPRGVNVTVEGFYNGDRVFKARAYAGELGLWRWRSRSNNPGLDGKEGTFRVVPSNLKGKLRIHSSDPRQFAYDNGAWFLHMAIQVTATWWRMSRSGRSISIRRLSRV